jgi:hypothetical protein
MTILKYGPSVKNLLRAPRASVIKAETAERESSRPPEGNPLHALQGNTIRRCLRGFVTV